MRTELVPLNGQQIKVKAKIERYGTAGSESVYLLTEVRNAATEDFLADHIWMPIGEWAAGFRVGDVIEFEATVENYVKGYFGTRLEVLAEKSSPSIDFHFVNVREAKILEQGPIPRIL